jgi:hypothetical protein
MVLYLVFYLHHRRHQRPQSSIVSISGLTLELVVTFTRICKMENNSKYQNSCLPFSVLPLHCVLTLVYFSDLEMFEVLPDAVCVRRTTHDHPFSR